MKLVELHQANCTFCNQDATKAVVWADGRAQIPVCDAHLNKAKQKVKSNGDKVVEIKAL